MRIWYLLIILTLFLTSCASVSSLPASSPAPSLAESTLTPTTSFLPTSSLAETQTPIPPDHGPLNATQKERLYQASLAYLADTEAQALDLARSMQFVQDDGHPSNMCGPLAAAILRDAGIVSPYTDLHDFWLLRPDVNVRALAETFPPDQFEFFHSDQRIDQFDFGDFPLAAGDFVYLYAGINGTFEHMLVVTRVDEAGRAYSVTNINTDDGYVISEEILYDPLQPAVGRFYEWTNRKNMWLGITGFGGFDLWRLKGPVHDPTPGEQKFAQTVDSILAENGGFWRVLIQQVGGDVFFARMAYRRGHVASLIKIPIAMLFFEALQQKGIEPDEYESYLALHGQGRTYAQLLRAMLVSSEEDATTVLLRATSALGLDTKATLQTWDVTDIDLLNRQATPRDIALLLEGLYSGQYLVPQARQIILDLMAEFTDNDDTRLGVLRLLLPPGSAFYNKRASLVEERLIIGDAALIVWPQGDETRAFVFVIMGSGSDEAPTNDLKLVAAIEAVARQFWESQR